MKMNWTPRNIKALRRALSKARGRAISQADMAEELGYGHANRVSDIERGVRSPSGTVVKLLNMLLVEVNGSLPVDERQRGFDFEEEEEEEEERLVAA